MSEKKEDGKIRQRKGRKKRNESYRTAEEHQGENHIRYLFKILTSIRRDDQVTWGRQRRDDHSDTYSLSIYTYKLFFIAFQPNLSEKMKISKSARKVRFSAKKFFGPPLNFDLKLVQDYRGATSIFGPFLVFIYFPESLADFDIATFWTLATVIGRPNATFIVWISLFSLSPSFSFSTPSFSHASHRRS